MGQAYQAIDGRLRDFILAQPMFFVGTAASGADGQIDVSPKAGAGCLAVPDEHRVVYLDCADGDDETLAHLRENGRVALLLCAFQETSRVVRLRGRGRVVPPEAADFPELVALFPEPPPEPRAVIEVTVEQVTESRDSGEVTEDLPAATAYPAKWLFRLPVLRSIKSQYEACVRMYDRDLLEYFDRSPRIADDERREARPAVAQLVTSIDAYQAWLELLWRIKPSLAWVAVWPAPWIFGVGAWLLASSPAAPGVKTAWAGGAILYMATYFASVFCGANFRDSRILSSEGMRIPWYVRALGGVLAGGVVAVIVAEFTYSSALSATGSLVIAFGLTFLAALTIAATAERIGPVRSRAALYMTEVAILTVAATAHRPHWPPWIVRGLWAGFWASAVFAILLGFLLVVAYLSTTLYMRWKNRRYAVGELVQTLLWLVMRIDDAGRYQEDRSDLSRQFPVPDPYGVAWDLEYVAEVIERSLPKVLDSGDRTGNKAITDRCRGIAVSVRALKSDCLLNQRSDFDALADALANAVVPIALGDWKSLAHVEPEQLPQSVSSWTRVLRWLGRIVAASTPLIVILILKANLDGSDKQLDPLIPVAVTWLLVSIVTWIDPGGGDRSSSVKNLLGAVPGVRSN